ncbi:MAG: preprotein translocase subunit YajC [Opitutaceae bacterium]
MTKLPLFLAQAQPAPTGAAALMQLAPLALLMAAMYFLVFAPQRKKQKAHDKMLTELKSGDEVITSGGIYGTITSVKDDRFVIRIGENNKIEVGKSFISAVVTKADAA